MPANIISGRVVLKESGIGIPDLLVVIYDVDAEAQAEDDDAGPESHGEREREDERGTPKGGVGDRIGSRLTDRDGAFRFSFDDEEFRIRDGKERRPDLQLVVMAPEVPAATPQVLYVSADVRQDAGRSEEYLIRLPSDTLSRAGVRIPTDPKGRAD